MQCCFTMGFFSGFGELKELYMAATPLCYCPSNKMVFRFLCWEPHTLCLPSNTKHCWEKSVGFLGFLTTGCQQGVWGAVAQGRHSLLTQGSRTSRAVMGMGGPASKEKLQRQPSCSRNELSFPDEDSRPRAFLGSSFLHSSALAVHKFNLQFSCWQELQEHLACGCKHTARGVWVTTGGQGAAGTPSRGGFGAGPGSEGTRLCTTKQRGFLVARANRTFCSLQRSVAALWHQAQIDTFTATASF